MVEIKNILIPDSDSNSTEWITYFKNLKQKAGVINAKVDFLKTWELQGNTSLKNDTEFVEYFKKYNMDFGSAIYDITSNVLEIGDSVLGMPKKVMKTARITALISLSLLIGIPTLLIIKSIIKK
jgi:hypothetical protein